MEWGNLPQLFCKRQFKYKTVNRNFYRTVLTPRNVIPLGKSLSWKGVVLPLLFGKRQFKYKTVNRSHFLTLLTFR